MKIGILTYHRSHNYGTMLQAIALRRAMTEFGYEVKFIDYWPNHQIRRYRLFKWDEFHRSGARGKARYMKGFLKTLGPKLVRRHRFMRFFRAEIAPFLVGCFAPLDAIVYGSDQIWRRQEFGDNCYNPVYFGHDGFRTSWRVSYAASMGILPNTPDEAKELHGLLAALNRISVREADLLDYVRSLGFSEAVQTIDPVFLPDPAIWEELAGPKPIVTQPYLLHYDLQRGSFNDSALRIFAANQGLEIVRIVGTAFHRPRGNVRTTDGPYEFLNLLKHASMVATSSFHGLAFSLLFRKPFLASYSERGGRAASLLQSVCLDNRLLPSQMAHLDDISPIDWTMVTEKLRCLRDLSRKWLREALEASGKIQS